SADWAVTALQERDLIEEAGRSEFGATLYRTTPSLLRYFGLRSLDELPDVSTWDPTPEEAGELRERLLRAGEARAGGAGADTAGAPVLDLDAEAGTEPVGMQDTTQSSDEPPAAVRDPLDDHGAADQPEIQLESTAGLAVDRWERELLLEG
ncbi:MAG: SMC-Scp complex subunit ScpB, partial [Solirubrobacteraceae bacterium]